SARPVSVAVGTAAVRVTSCPSVSQEVNGNSVELLSGTFGQTCNDTSGPVQGVPLGPVSLRKRRSPGSNGSLNVPRLKMNAGFELAVTQGGGGTIPVQSALTLN